MSGLDRINERWANTTPGPWTHSGQIAQLLRAGDTNAVVIRWASVVDLRQHPNAGRETQLGLAEECERDAEAIARAPHDIRLLLNVARAIDNFGGETGHSFHCFKRTKAAGWKPGEPPIIHCTCGLEELEKALRELDQEPG